MLTKMIVAALHALAVKVEILEHEALRCLHRRFEPQHFLDGRRNSRGVVAKRFPQTVFEQQIRAVADQPRRRFMSGDEQQQARVVQFALAQRVAGFLGAYQLTDQVVARSCRAGS